MKFRILKFLANWFWTAAIVAVVVIGAVTFQRWWPTANALVNGTVAHFRTGAEEVSTAHDDSDPHAGHGHATHSDHSGHEETTSLELSEQALRNVGLTGDQIGPVKLGTYQKSMTVPAVIVERPGRTIVQVATPMTGVITHVHAVQGEAVDPGTLLFKIRLTHEDLVQAQTNFLKALGEIDIERREIARLQAVTRSGAVAGKVLLNREYARDKLNSTIRAQQEALRLHGLSKAQVDRIARERRLLRELQIIVPTGDGENDDQLRLSRQTVRPASYHQDSGGSWSNPSIDRTPLILQKLNVHKGQSVNAGETLCFLAAYDELFIEGLAFEQDIEQLRKTSDQGWGVDAIFENSGAVTGLVKNLEIALLKQSDRLELANAPILRAPAKHNH